MMVREPAAEPSVSSLVARLRAALPAVSDESWTVKDDAVRNERGVAVCYFAGYGNNDPGAYLRWIARADPTTIARLLDELELLQSQSGGRA